MPAYVFVFVCVTQIIIMNESLYIPSRTRELDGKILVSLYTVNTFFFVLFVLLLHSGGIVTLGMEFFSTQWL